jgi:hypothetical protein
VNLADDHGAVRRHQLLGAAKGMDLLSLNVDLDDGGGRCPASLAKPSRLITSMTIVSSSAVPLARCEAVDSAIANLRVQTLSDTPRSITATFARPLSAILERSASALRGVGFEGDHRPRAADESRSEKRKKPDVRTQVVEDDPGTKQLDEGLLQEWLGSAESVPGVRAARVDPHPSCWAMANRRLTGDESRSQPAADPS